MTIRKKIFYTNTIMVFISLFILLGIGGLLISIFKDEFMTRFSESSEISEHISEVESVLLDPDNADLSFREWDRILKTYDFRYYAEDSSGRKQYSNLKHREWEVVEEIKKNEFGVGQVKMYFMEGTTILATKIKNGTLAYTIIAVDQSKERTFLGIDRGMFEMFIIVFLITGGLAIAGILFCSQLFTKRLIKHILRPLEELNEATIRMGEGNLSQSVDYQKEDEFKPVCDSFDLMQDNLKKSMEKQLAYEKARTEMVSGISHDLRTPLTSIKGYIKGMMDGIANTEEKRAHYLGIAYKKSCDMDVLLSKLFYFSKLETGNMPFFKQDIDMKQLLETYVQEKQMEVQERDVNLEMINEIEDTLCCNIDKEQTKRVFDNLIENSIKYANVEKLEIRIKLTMITELGKQFLNIQFHDNGIGLEEEKLNHVFEQFYRGDEARTSKNDGNGLGLYVCKYIMEQQNGKIEAKSQEGFLVNLIFPIS